MSVIQAAVFGLHSLQWVGILLARLTVGGLFFLSGRRKLFTRAGGLQMRETLQKASVPFPKQTAVAVSTVEFVCGGLLLLGALTPLACVLLASVMGVALATTQLRTLHATSTAAWLSAALYLPEVLYLVLLLWLFFSGPGWLSVDEWLLY
jgi:putative oxidoreductase